MRNKNTPYVKKYSEDGILTNPIGDIYPQPFPNRRKRRSDLRELMKQFARRTRKRRLELKAAKKNA